jgi:hypothetical protein
MSLQEKASQDSGVSQEDAFSIDQVNMSERLGTYIFVQLSAQFYNRVYNDPDAWVLDSFAPSPKEDATHNPYEFFIQGMGVQPLYS